MKKITIIILLLLTCSLLFSCGQKLEINDKALCKRCLKRYENHKAMNCPHCAQPYNSCTCSNIFLRSHGVEKLFKVFQYKPGQKAPHNDVIYALKEDNRKDVFNLCIEELSSAIASTGEEFKDVIVTSIPRRKSTITPP